ncbi:hypothetical protein E2C01_065520 [Portunus trituberculatus]|uniref:Uncharacterized protein n=1 Tax=Portunus trituberculatus TaxID=210409 RepID=A0A5B7HRB4_PORTR|nr:hypothetical protein [Portunus trituberculatus]
MTGVRKWKRHTQKETNRDSATETEVQSHRQREKAKKQPRPRREWGLVCARDYEHLSPDRRISVLVHLPDVTLLYTTALDEGGGEGGGRA